MALTELNYEPKKAVNYTVFRTGDYQMQITNVVQIEGKNPVTGVPTQQLQFDAQVVEGKYLGESYRFWTTLSWFTANEAKKKMFNPSKLFLLQQAINKYYNAKVDANSMKDADVINLENINAMVGKQIIVTVQKVDDGSEKGKNKTLGFDPIDKVIEYEPIVKEAKKDSQEDFEKEVFGEKAQTA